MFPVYLVNLTASLAGDSYPFNFMVTNRNNASYAMISQSVVNSKIGGVSTNREKILRLMVQISLFRLESWVIYQYISTGTRHTMVGFGQECYCVIGS